MNLSIITAAIPSMGRLVMELQPNNFAFPINEGPIDSPHFGDKENIPSVRSSFARDFNTSRSGNAISSIHGTRWRDTILEDDESMFNLVQSQSPSHTIQQTVDFEVH